MIIAGEVVEQLPEGEREAAAEMFAVPGATPVTVVAVPGEATLAIAGFDEVQETEEAEPQLEVIVTLLPRLPEWPVKRVSV